MDTRDPFALVEEMDGILILSRPKASGVRLEGVE